MRRWWLWLRRRVVQMSIRSPGLAAALVFFFLFTVSNHVEFTTGMVLQISPFWHMLIMGVVLAVFGAMLMLEVIQEYRRLAEVQMVRTVVATLHHEINNPLTVIQLSAEKLHDLQRYDAPTVTEILAHGTRIHNVVAKLNQLDEEVHLRQEQGFEGLIDIGRSR